MRRPFLFEILPQSIVETIFLYFESFSYLQYHINYIESKNIGSITEE